MTAARRSGSHRGARTPAAAPAPARHFLLAAAIVLAGALTYANSLSSPLLFDDNASIVRNPTITDPRSFGSILVPPADGPVAGRPLVNLSFALNLALAGPNVAAFHSVNVALHLGCALLIFGVVRRTLRLPGASGALPWRPEHTAFAVALLWTVHPINSEVVNYTTQRSESMMAACYLLAVYAAARSLEPGASRRWLAVGPLAVLVGTGCKETIATAPLFIVMYDRAFGFSSFRDAFRARWRFYLALAATWAPLGLMVASHGQSFSAGFASAEASTFQYFLNQPAMILRYLWLTLWPQSLVLYYGWPAAVTIADVWLPLALVTALFVVTVIAMLKHPRLGVLGAAVFLTLGPTSSVILIATEVGAERRMYLASVAVLLLVIAGVAKLFRGLQDQAALRSSPAGLRSSPAALRTATGVLLIVVALALAGRTVLRNREYASALVMAETILARWPTPNAHYLVGVELAAAGRNREAIDELQRAVPGYPPAFYYLGQELFKANRFDEAAASLRRFVAAEPLVAAVRPARILMARAYEAAGKPRDAVAELLPLASGPGNTDVHALLANVFSGLQEFDRAIPHYLAYLQAQPKDGDAWTGLGIAYASLNRQGDAINAFQQAVAAQPDNPNFRSNLERARGRVP